MVRKLGIPETRFHSIRGSLNEEQTIRKLVNETVKKFGRLDIVVCNAAVTNLPNDPDFFSTKALRYIMEVNLIR